MLYRGDALEAVGDGERGRCCSMKWLTLDERLELARRAAARAGKTPVVATANLSAGASKMNGRWPQKLKPEDAKAVAVWHEQAARSGWLDA